MLDSFILSKRFSMALEIDFAQYMEHFENLKRPNAKIQVFGKNFSIEELKTKAKEIAEPKNPVNDKKLPQKKGLSTNVVFGKTGKKRLLERIYESNIDAFLRVFPDVVRQHGLSKIFVSNMLWTGCYLSIRLSLNLLLNVRKWLFRLTIFVSRFRYPTCLRIIFRLRFQRV